MIRTDGRQPDEMRRVNITRGYIPHAEGSVLMELGQTKVLCVITLEDGVPAFLKGTGTGWVTAEYSMLPRATPERSRREAVIGRQGGRTMEIQRLIGRSLRAVTDLTSFGERTFWVDCDVINADGGTRTAAVTGAYVALREAFDTLLEEGALEVNPSTGYLAAVSSGMVNGVPCLDLCFEEDVHAEVDLNLVADDRGDIIEIQATSERKTLSRRDLDSLVDLALLGISDLVEYQKSLLEG